MPFITNGPDGGIEISYVQGPDPDKRLLAKILFELSRTTDLTVTHNHEIHTLDAISKGITGHRAIRVLGEIEGSEIPKDRTNRDGWTWDNIRNAIDTGA